MAKTVEDTGWQPIKPVEQAVDVRTEEVIGAGGEVAMVTGLEEKPCVMCVHYDNVDRNRIVRHLLSKRLVALPNGKFETPIAKDFPGRVSLQLDPTDFGYCRKECYITQSLATCPLWAPTRTQAELQQRLGGPR